MAPLSRSRAGIASVEIPSGYELSGGLDGLEDDAGHDRRRGDEGQVPGADVGDAGVRRDRPPRGLSVVGTERLQGSGYFRAKLAQEETIKAAASPSTILRATQFFEFIGRIADSSTQDGTVALPLPWPISPGAHRSTAPSSWAAPNGSGWTSSSGAS
jgi:hypothetical protein